jgi:hypothetical protein
MLILTRLILGVLIVVSIIATISFIHLFYRRILESRADGFFIFGVPMVILLHIFLVWLAVTSFIDVNKCAKTLSASELSIK